MGGREGGVESLMKEERRRKDKKNKEWLEDRLWGFFSSALATFDLLFVNSCQKGLFVCLHPPLPLSSHPSQIPSK